MGQAIAGPWPFWLPAGAGPAPRLSWLPFSLDCLVLWRRRVADQVDRYFDAVSLIELMSVPRGVL